MLPSSSFILLLILIQISDSHPIRKRCLSSPCRDDSESPNIKILLETVDDETRKPVQKATGYYIANKNYSLSLTPPPVSRPVVPPVTPTPFPSSSQSSLPHLVPPSYPPPLPATRSPHSFHFLPPSSSSSSSIVRSPIFLRSDPLPSSHLVASVYKNPSGVVHPSSQLQPPPFVVVKVKKVSPPPAIEIITTPRSQATLTPTTTVFPSHRFPFTTPFPHSFHFIPPSSTLSTTTPSTPSSSTSNPYIDPTLPSLSSQSSFGPPSTVPTSVLADSTTVATTSDRMEMSEEELRRKVVAMLNKNQLLCTMFGICEGLKDVPATVTPKTVYNPSPTEYQFEFRPRIVTAPTTPSPFQFVFEFASTIAPTLKKLNQELPLFSARYAANPSPIMPHPKGLNPNKMTLSSLLSSIVSSPLASHCPSCVQLLLNLCPTEGRSSKDCIVSTTMNPLVSPPTPSPSTFHSPIRSQPTFTFSFPNPITGQQINAAAVVPTTTTLRPWQTTYARTSSPTTIDPFAPLMDDDVQYDFDFDKRPTESIQYDEGGGYGLVGERRGVLPWSIKRAG